MENVRSFLKIAVFVEASFLCRNLYSVGQKFRLFIFLVTISNDVLCTLFLACGYLKESATKLQQSCLPLQIGFSYTNV